VRVVADDDAAWKELASEERDRDVRLHAFGDHFKPVGGGMAVYHEARPAVDLGRLLVRIAEADEGVYQRRLDDSAGPAFCRYVDGQAGCERLPAERERPARLRQGGVDPLQQGAVVAFEADDEPRVGQVETLRRLGFLQVGFRDRLARLDFGRRLDDVHGGVVVAAYRPLAIDAHAEAERREVVKWVLTRAAEGGAD